MKKTSIRALYRYNRESMKTFFDTFRTEYLPDEFPLVQKFPNDLKRNNNVDKTVALHMNGDNNAVLMGVFFNGNINEVIVNKGYRSFTMFEHTIIIRSLVELPSGRLSYKWDVSICQSSKEIEQKTREFKINDYITLKLEGVRTNIYVGGKIFNHCKYILLNLSPEDIPKYDEIDNMDEAIELYRKNRNNKAHERNKKVLKPLTAFWGHCSNLQAWADYNYNLDVLHSSLSVGLLKKLVELGDPKAKISLKIQIVTRIKKGYNRNVIRFFLNEKFLDLFTIEELDVLIEECPPEKKSHLLTLLEKMLSKKLPQVPELTYKKCLEHMILGTCGRYEGCKECKNYTRLD